MEKVKYISIVLLLVLFSCRSRGEKNRVFSNLDTAVSPRLIPYYEDSSVKGSSQDLFVKNLGKLMSLPTLSSVKEGTNIRIWVWDQKVNYVIDINQNNKDTYCNVFEFGGVNTGLSDSIAIYRERKGLIPQSGWNFFFDTVNKYQILSLENGTIQNKRKISLSYMAYVQFEIATPGKYKFYEYIEPSYYRFIDTASNNVYRFLNFFNNEMNLKIYSPSSKLFLKPD